MAKGTKFQVSHPDGTFSTRTSASRLYTHAVAVRTSKETKVADLLDLAERFDRCVEVWSESTDYRWQTPESQKASIEKAAADAARCRQEATEVPDHGVWAVFQWNGRIDLAVKAAAGVSGWASFAEVRVVEVDQVEKFSKAAA